MAQKPTRSYRRLDLSDRKIIEQALDERLSYRKIAELLEVAPSTIKREVDVHTVISASYQDALAGRYSIKCEVETESRCSHLHDLNGLCNGCKRKCMRNCQHVHRLYCASIANFLSQTTRSSARKGIDVDQAHAEELFFLIRQSLANKLSPAYIAASVEGVDVSESTIYRWIDKGIGGLCNMDLPKKVAYKPRRHTKEKCKPSHSKKRLYSAFACLDEEVQTNRWEMDSVVGRASKDCQCLLTLHHKPTHFQIALLLPEHTSTSVVLALSSLRDCIGQDAMNDLFGCVLTDNGSEFQDEDLLSHIFGEDDQNIRLFYCDPGHSEQKGSCEKNHVEIRKILPKRLTIFDRLTQDDLSVVMCHVNSYARQSLNWKTPLEMFLFYFPKSGKVLCDALGIYQVKTPRLTPDLLNECRRQKGEPDITTR